MTSASGWTVTTSAAAPALIVVSMVVVGVVVVTSAAASLAPGAHWAPTVGVRTRKLPALYRVNIIILLLLVGLDGRTISMQIFPTDTCRGVIVVCDGRVIRVLISTHLILMWLNGTSTISNYLRISSQGSLLGALVGRSLVQLLGWGDSVVFGAHIFFWVGC